MDVASSNRAVVTLPTDTEILITRELDAQKHLVYKAWTTPELIKRWWAGERGEVTLAEVDLRVGGKWHIVMVAHGEFEVGFHGVYTEIVPNERLVNTEVFDAMPEAEGLDIITFAESDGRTTLSILMRLASKEIRDGVIASGMEGGVQEQMVKLEAVATSLL